MTSKISLILFVFFLSNNVSGQDTKFIQKQKYGTIEEYYVLKKDKKIKHGQYIKYKTHMFGGQIVVIESGNYNNGLKDDIWEIYHDQLFSKNTWNKLKAKGVYVQGKKNGLWKYYYPDTTDIPLNISHVAKDSTVLHLSHEGTRLKQVGLYISDEKYGVWSFFDYNGNLIQKYNYSTKKLLLDNSIKDSSQYNLNRRAIFIGGISTLINNFTGDKYFTSYPQYLLKLKQDSILVNISFEIDKAAVVKSVKVSANTGEKEFQKTLIEDFTAYIQKTADSWIPALAAGEETIFTYKMQYSLVRKEFENRKYWKRTLTVLN